MSEKMIDTTTKEEWIREYDLMQNRACDAEAENARYKEALEKMPCLCWHSGFNKTNCPESIAQKALKGK